MNSFAKMITVVLLSLDFFTFFLDLSFRNPQDAFDPSNACTLRTTPRS